MFLGSYVLDRRCDFRGSLEMGEPVLPRAMLFHRPLDILYQIAEALPCVVAGALVVDIAADPLNQVGPGTGGREPEQRQPGGVGQPLLDGFGCMHTVINVSSG